MKSRQNAILSRAKIEEARRLRKLGHSWTECGAAIGVSDETIRRHLDLVYRERRNASARECKKIRYAERRSGDHRRIQLPSSRPPASVLADRDARAFAPRSLSATILGDPPVGYSALDRRQ